MIGSDFLEYIPLTALYAETHYRFRFFPFSLYYRKQPEIIFDAPLRIEPDRSLPVTLMIKDSDKYPISLTTVKLVALSGRERVEQTFELNGQVQESFWHRLFELDVSRLLSGVLTVKATAVIRTRKGKLLHIYQDNHPGLSHKPLSVFKSSDPLPTFPTWYAGELHCHTSYGTDQVEFGAPLESYQRTAEAMGLSWVALTDHSYNLDNRLDNYLLNDPDAPKWNLLREEADRLNQSGTVVLLPGEELSCRSSEGRNIHMLIVGNPEFLRGTGDDAQNWLRTTSEHSVEKAGKLVGDTAFVAAGHPFVRIPLLERLLVNRGEWKRSDLSNPLLDGWQLLNGQWDDEFDRGMQQWIEALDEGRRIYIYAGNDAHGNFNRFRQVKLPMVKLWERDCHLFGRVTTRVFIAGELTQSAIIVALKQGRAVISDGPAIELSVRQDGSLYHSGDEVELSGGGQIVIRYKTSEEFGMVKRLTLHSFNEKKNIDLQNSYDGERRIDMFGDKYLRAELHTDTESGESHHAYTNPIWIRQPV